MKTEDFKTIPNRIFPNNPFFGHLKKGIASYNEKNYGRAIEEFTEARIIHTSNPIKLEALQGKVAFKGKLAETPLLFQQFFIQANKLSGVGILQSQGKKRKFIFMNGNLIRAISSNKKDRVGNYLVRKKIMSAQELDQHAVESKKRKRKIGSWLVMNKFISKKILQEILQLQTEEIFSDSLIWTDGQFFFKETLIKEPPSVNFTPLRMALISSIRGFNFEDFKTNLESNKIIFKPASHAVKNKESIMKRLDTNDQFIFFLVNGTRNIDQLIEFSGNDEISVVNILYKLCSLGLIRKAKDIREYEDKTFNEVKMILGVLFDIYYIVVNELTEELGKYGKEMIKEVQSDLYTEHAVIFRGIPLDNQNAMQINMIMKNIAFYFPDHQKRFIFIDAFLEVYKKSLTKLRKYLGIGLRGKTIEQMKLIILNLERFSINTELKSHMLRSLKQLIK